MIFRGSVIAMEQVAPGRHFRFSVAPGVYLVRSALCSVPGDYIVQKVRVGSGETVHAGFGCDVSVTGGLTRQGSRCRTANGYKQLRASLAKARRATPNETEGATPKVYPDLREPNGIQRASRYFCDWGSRGPGFKSRQPDFLDQEIWCPGPLASMSLAAVRRQS